MPRHVRCQPESRKRPSRIDLRSLAAQAGGMTQRRRSIRTALTALVVATLITGCGVVRSQALLATLPTSAAGITFDASEVIDNSFNMGYAGDAVLAALGKRREDATMVDRYSVEGDAEIGALVVDGVAGDLLLDTFVRTWDDPATIARSETTIDNRDVWTIETRDGRFTMAYQSGATVYWAYGPDRALTQQLVAAMP